MIRMIILAESQSIPPAPPSPLDLTKGFPGSTSMAFHHCLYVVSTK